LIVSIGFDTELPKMASSSLHDLAQLEYEFATNPNSEAFIPLAEAYLGVGRFVEAMVVCKKGIKAHPDLPTGRLIMARIYSDQAKHQKAINELTNLLKMAPEHADALHLMGNIYLKLGREEEGVEHLKKALDHDPQLQAAKDSLLKKGIDYTPKVAPAPAPAPAPAEPAVAEAPTQKAMPVSAPAQTPAPQAAATPIEGKPTEKALPISASPAPAQAPAPAAVPTPAQMTPQPLAAAAGTPKKRIADIYQDLEEKSRKPAAKNSLRYTMYLGGLGCLFLIIYIIYTWQAGLKQKEINTHLEEGRSFFNQDTYQGYQKALEHYQAIYKLDKHYDESLARGAFIAAVLPGEFGGSRELFKEGTKFINQALSDKQNSAMLNSARAFMALYGGGGNKEALDILENALKDTPQSAILHTSMGYVLLKKGSLGEARDHLLEGAGQSDIRALVGLGLYAMRRSMYREAIQAFNRALQSDRGHTRSVLYKGILALIWSDTAIKNQIANAALTKFRSDLEAQASDREKTYAALIDAVLKTRLRKTRKAGLAALQALLKKNSSEALFQFVGAREMRRLRKLKMAKEMIGRALRINSSRPDFALEEAALYLALKDFEATRARAMRVQEMDSESGQSSILIGDAYRGEKNFAKAISYYKEAEKYDDTSAMAHFKQGMTYLTKTNPDADRAQAQFELAVPGLISSGESRRAAETCVLLAKIYANKNRHREFLKILKSGLRADPTYAPPHCLIAANLSTDSADSRAQVKEYCTNCLKLDSSGEYSKNCRETLKSLR